MKTPLEQEMSISETEFWRVLNRAFPEARQNRSGQQAELPVDNGRVCVSVTPQAMRQVGSLRLPVMKVCLEFDNLTEASAGRFVERFNRSFQRGGG